MIHSTEDIDRLEKPNHEKDGLLPFVIKRIKFLQPEIEHAGHKVRFAVARGPLNISSFLMGTTEFLMAIAENTERFHQLLSIISDFLADWMNYQRECFPKQKAFQREFIFGKYKSGQAGGQKNAEHGPQ